jgi:hypothetical protein
MDAPLAYGGFLLSMGAIWGLFGYLRALRKVVRRRLYKRPDLGGCTSGFRMGGRSGFPGVWGGLGAAFSRPKWAYGAHSQAEGVGVEPGALNSGFGARVSRFRLPVWPAPPDSAQCGVMVGRWARMVPCGIFLES